MKYSNVSNLNDWELLPEIFVVLSKIFYFRILRNNYEQGNKIHVITLFWFLLLSTFTEVIDSGYNKSFYITEKSKNIISCMDIALSGYEKKLKYIKYSLFSQQIFIQNIQIQKKI